MARIVLDGVTKVFGSEVVAVNDMSLDIRDGEFMVLVGPSRVREVHDPAPLGRPRGRYGRRDFHRRPAGDGPAAEGARGRAGPER
jgi:hypothetical protein